MLCDSIDVMTVHKFYNIDSTLTAVAAAPAGEGGVELVTVKTVPADNNRGINQKGKPDGRPKKPANPVNPGNPVNPPQKPAKKEGIWSSLTTLPLVQQLANSIGMKNG